MTKLAQVARAIAHVQATKMFDADERNYAKDGLSRITQISAIADHMAAQMTEEANAAILASEKWDAGKCV